MNYKSGFTLAEVLITLGIIGIVAALTIPTLISKYQERELLTRTKKVYAQIAGAVDMARAKNSNYIDNSGLFSPQNTSEETMREFSQYFKTVEICKAKADGCGGRYYYKLMQPISNDGETYAGQYFWDAPRFMTADGAIIAVYQKKACHRVDIAQKYDENGNAVYENGEPVLYEMIKEDCASLTVDINGKNGPNQLGRDVYSIQIWPAKLHCESNRFGGSMQDVIKNNKLPDVEDYEIGGKVPKENE